VGIRGSKQDGADGQGKDDGKWKDSKQALFCWYLGPYALFQVPSLIKVLH
jgi:hypothetical protein